MSDARKFCWACFVGSGLSAAAQNHGLWHAPANVGDGVAIIINGLLLGCLSIIIFGRRDA